MGEYGFICIVYQPFPFYGNIIWIDVTAGVDVIATKKEMGKAALWGEAFRR